MQRYYLNWTSERGKDWKHGVELYLRITANNGENCNTTERQNENGQRNALPFGGM